MSSVQDFFGSKVEAPIAAEPAPGEPVRWTTATTPSGIEIRYVSEPKRKYQVAGPETGWHDAVSVTTALEVLDKPALPWWGMKIGVEGVLKLYELGEIEGKLEDDFEFPLYTGDQKASVEGVVELLKTHKLTVNHAKDTAGRRGVNVHDAFETWLTTGALPHIHSFPEEEKGYIQGLLAWIYDIGDVSGNRSEIMVGSLEHGYAGRYDGEFTTHRPVEVVVHHTPKRGSKRETVNGYFLVDLKTSRDVYPTSHFRQLAAYEQARQECGYKPTDGQYVLHVDEFGNYKFVRSTAVFADFKAVLKVYRSNQRLKEKP